MRVTSLSLSFIGLPDLDHYHKLGMDASRIIFPATVHKGSWALIPPLSMGELLCGQGPQPGVAKAVNFALAPFARSKSYVLVAVV